MILYGNDYEHLEAMPKDLADVDDVLRATGADHIIGLDRDDEVTQKAKSDLVHRIALGISGDNLITILHEHFETPGTGERVSGRLIAIGRARLVFVEYSESDESNARSAVRDLVFTGPTVEVRGPVHSVSISALKRGESRGVKYTDPEFMVKFAANTHWVLNSQTVGSSKARMEALAKFLWSMEGSEDSEA